MNFQDEFSCRKRITIVERHKLGGLPRRRGEFIIRRAATKEVANGMSVQLKGRHLLTLRDYSPEEIRFLVRFARELKAEKRAGKRPLRLAGKNVALIFEKPSTRTRCSFVVACNDEGAFPEYLGKDEIQLGKKETVKDTARVLGRLFDGIQYRGFAQSVIEALAEHAGVPVWNGLTDVYHPTQVLADLMTIEERFGRLEGIRLAYVGDGRNNMANSLMVGGSKVGMDVRIVTPAALAPDPGIRAACDELAAASGGAVTVTDDLGKGVKGADVIYTDVWASMGEESLLEERIALLGSYRITAGVLAATGNPEVIFLHCLPSFHNLETAVAARHPDVCEVTEEVFEGPHSLVFDQSENRVHTIKAVMIATLG